MHEKKRKISAFVAKNSRNKNLNFQIQKGI